MNNDEQKSFNTSDVILSLTPDELELLKDILSKVVFLQPVPEELWRKVMDA